MMTTLTNQLFPFNDKLYIGFKRIKIDRIDENYAKYLKEIWNCDMLLKTPQYGGVYLFLREIQDVEFEDIILSDQP
jgi:hypothetical protein